MYIHPNSYEKVDGVAFDVVGEELVGGGQHILREVLHRQNSELEGLGDVTDVETRIHLRWQLQIFVPLYRAVAVLCRLLCDVVL